MWRVVYVPSFEDTTRISDADTGVAALELAKRLLHEGHAVYAINNATGKTVLNETQITELFGRPWTQPTPVTR